MEGKTQKVVTSWKITRVFVVNGTFNIKSVNPMSLIFKPYFLLTKTSYSGGIQICFKVYAKLYT